MAVLNPEAETETRTGFPSGPPSWKRSAIHPSSGFESASNTSRTWRSMPSWRCSIPAGSVKDRPALQMIRDAEASGDLTPEKILIDSTSGNTGIAYAMIGAALGYRVKLVMPENVSVERRYVIRSYGADLVLSDPVEGSDGAILKCREIVEENPGLYYKPGPVQQPFQFQVALPAYRARDLEPDGGKDHTFRGLAGDERDGDGDRPATEGIRSRHPDYRRRAA